MVPGRRPSRSEWDNVRSDRSGARHAHGDTARDRRPRPYLRDVGDDSCRRGHVGTAAVADAADPQRQPALEHNASDHRCCRRSRRACVAHLLRGLDAALGSVSLAPTATVRHEQLHPSIDGIQQISCTVTDSAGNQTTLNDFIHIDTTAPLLTPTVANPVVLNGTTTASANASDTMSSVAFAKLQAGRDEHRGHFHRHVHGDRRRRGTRTRQPPTTWCSRRVSASANRAARYCSR